MFSAPSAVILQQSVSHFIIKSLLHLANFIVKFKVFQSFDLNCCI